MIPWRRVVVACIAWASASLACALEIQPYKADSFDKARAAGKVTALQFHSGWCPVCVMQERGLRSLQDKKSLSDVVVYRADFFAEDALRKKFNVTSFSTLVVFRGDMERARTTGDFKPEDLQRLFDQAL